MEPGVEGVGGVDESESSLNTTGVVRRGGQRLIKFSDTFDKKKSRTISEDKVSSCLTIAHERTPWRGVVNFVWDDKIQEVSYLLVGSGATTLWGSRHSEVFLVSLAAFRSSKVGATEAGVYIG